MREGNAIAERQGGNFARDPHLREQVQDHSAHGTAGGQTTGAAWWSVIFGI